MKARQKSKIPCPNINEAVSDGAEPDYADPPRRRRAYASWHTKGLRRRKTIRLLRIAKFSTRGLTFVYGREDHFGTTVVCKCDMWMRKEGRIFVRFHSPRRCLHSLSYELLGLKLPSKLERNTALMQPWVPEILRDEYDDWVRKCLEDPYDNG